MSYKINYTNIKELSLMKKAPSSLYYKGDKELLKKRKISIVGSRRPTNYTKEFTYKLAKEFAKRDFAIVSGAAMGVDAIAHKGAGASNTIAIMAGGIDILYPAINKDLLLNIQKYGLTLSMFEKNFKPTKWSFVVRNELVVALGEILIITEADLNSGSLRSAQFALRMNKPIYVLPHRLNESLGTNNLLNKDLAKIIYDINEFANSFKKIEEENSDILTYLNSSPSFNEALLKLGDKIYELELEGVIKIENGFIKVI